MAATIYALINQKGGVGKTTETYSLTRALVASGKRVLAIDADPQGNLSGILAEENVEADQLTFADVLLGEKVHEVAVEGIWEGLAVLPGNSNTTKAIQQLHTEHGREYRLKEALADSLDHYDIILIDCAPSLELHTINALAAAHRALVICQPGKFSLDGLSQLQLSFDSVSRYYNPLLTVAGVIVNGNRNTLTHKAWIGDLVEASPWRVFTPYVPYWSVIQDAMEAGLGLDEWPGDDKARQAYEIYARHLGNLDEIDLRPHLEKMFPKHDYSTLES
ncbi:ParA family protein [Pseudarthrobacter sp. NPDC055928]|jgi:chromosome partitioning protein|uniref:ParA family protein n=1 Tax=Pseudarthrobacter sp. NPDC055928 TaxID=3345661 RepID=UPI001066055A